MRRPFFSGAIPTHGVLLYSMIGLLVMVFPPNRIKEDFPSGVVGPIHVISFLVAQPSGCLALVSECMYRVIIFLQKLR